MNDINKIWKDFVKHNYNEPAEEKNTTDKQYDLSLLPDTIFERYKINHDDLLNEVDDILFEQLLMEGRWENFNKKYGDKINAIFKNVVGPTDPDELEKTANLNTELALEKIESANAPTKHKFSNATGKLFLDAMSKFESKWTDPGSGKYLDRDAFEVLEHVLTAIEVFDKNKSGMKIKDINQYKSLSQLEKAIYDDLSGPRIKKAKKKREEERYSPRTASLYEEYESAIVYEDDRYFVVRPHTVESSCYFGAKTKWCISQTGNSYFQQYKNREGLVFYFVKDDSQHPDKKYAKVAIQCRLVDGEGDIDGFWDRDDDWHDDLDDLIDKAKWPEETFTEMVEAIEEHLSENPPEKDDALERKHDDISRGYENVEFDDSGQSKIRFMSDYDYYSDDPMLSLSAELFLAIPMPENILARGLDKEFLEAFYEEIFDILNTEEVNDEFGDYNPLLLEAEDDYDLIDNIVHVNAETYHDDPFLKIAFPLPVPDPSGYNDYTAASAWFYNVEQVEEVMYDIKYRLDEGAIESIAEAISLALEESMPEGRTEGYKKIEKIIQAMWENDGDIFKNSNVLATYETRSREAGDDVKVTILDFTFTASFFLPFTQKGRAYLPGVGTDQDTKKVWYDFVNFIRDDIGTTRGSKRKSKIFQVFSDGIEKLNREAIVAAAMQVKIDFPDFDKHKDIPKIILRPTFLEPYFSVSKDPPGITLRFESEFIARKADALGIDIAYSFYKYIDENYDKILKQFRKDFIGFIVEKVPKATGFFDTENIEERVYRIITNLLE